MLTATDQTPKGARIPRLRAAAAPLARSDRLPLPVTLYLLAVVVPLACAVGPLYLTALRLVLIVMMVPLTLRLLSGACGRLIATDALFVLHIVWGGIAIAVNTPDQAIQQIGSVGVEFLGGYLIGRVYIRTPAAFMALARMLILLVLCTAPFAVIEALTGRPVILALLDRLPGLTSLADVPMDRRMGLDRVQAVFEHPIHYGLFCSVAFSLCIVALRGTMTTARRLATGGLVAASGFLALSSGALMAIALQCGLIVWAALLGGVRARWWILAGLGVLAYVAVDLTSNRSPLQVFMSYATFSPHNAYWRALTFEWGMKTVAAHPLFGIGLNDWARPAFMYSDSVDNFWLLMAMRYGIPGFVLVTAGYLLVLVRVMGRDLSGHPRLLLLRRSWVFTFLGLTFTLCTVHVWTNIYSFVFFMFGAGVWFIFHDPQADTADTAAPAGPRRALPYSRFAPQPGARAP